MNQNIYLRKQFSKRILKSLPCLILAIGGVWGQTYFPPYGQWERQQPKDVAVNSRNLERDVKFPNDHENQAPKKLEELSQQFKISRERVRQIEEKAMEKLQKEISNIA